MTIMTKNIEKMDKLMAEYLLNTLQHVWLRTVWPRDIELASRAVIEGKQAVLLGSGSVLYVAQQAAD